MLIAIMASPAWSQSAVDPRMIEFIPSANNLATLADGRPAVTQDQVEIATAGTTEVLQRVSLGKPAPAADGMIRANFAASLIATPVAGRSYDARILTVGPQGTTASTRSNPFTFSACQFTLSAASASFAAAGGTGSVGVTASAGYCSWTAASSAAWLRVTSAASAVGSGTVAFSVDANTSGASRTATLSMGGATFTVTEAGSAPQTIDVTTEAQLQAAVASLASNQTIRIAPGTYRLTATLQVEGPLAGVVLKGSTGRPEDVLIVGQGMTVNGSAPTALSVTGDVQGLQLSDVTIQDVYRHAVLFDNGPQSPKLTNLQLVNCGDVCLAALASGASVDDGTLESSWVGYTSNGASTSAGGVSLRGAKRWTIRANAFENVRGPSGQIAKPAMGVGGGAADTVVEGNSFMNVSTAVALGLVDMPGATDHSGGRVANNMIYRATGVGGGAGISIADSPGTRVAHNTVIGSGTYANPIDDRFVDAANLTIVNNLTDGAITARDGASAAQAGNLTNATPELFVNAAAGDLHLKPTAAAAIDVADVSTSLTADIDNETRPKGHGPDVGADEVAAAAQSVAPTVQLLQPTNGTVFKTGANVQIQAQAQDADGSVAKVEFYVNSTLVGSATAAPFTIQWSAKSNGTFSIVATAIDNLGNRASSQPIMITVNRKGR